MAPAPMVAKVTVTQASRLLLLVAFDRPHIQFPVSFPLFIATRPIRRRPWTSAAREGGGWLRCGQEGGGV